MFLVAKIGFSLKDFNTRYTFRRKHGIVWVRVFKHNTPIVIFSSSVLCQFVGYFSGVFIPFCISNHREVSFLELTKILSSTAAKRIALPQRTLYFEVLQDCLCEIYHWYTAFDAPLDILLVYANFGLTLSFKLDAFCSKIFIGFIKKSWTDH